MPCIITGSPFVGKFGTTTGRKILIESGSTEEDLIARCMESHLGFRITTMLVNKHRREEVKERVEVSAVMNVFYCLQPKGNIIKKAQSGGLNQAWMDASYNIAKKIQIMLGRISDDEVMTDDSTGTKFAYSMQITTPRFTNHKHHLQSVITPRMVMLIRQSNTHLTPSLCYSLVIRHHGPPPPWFDRNNLPKIIEQQIAS